MSSDRFQIYRSIQESICWRSDHQFGGLTHTQATFFFIDWLVMQTQDGGWYRWYYDFPAATRRLRIQQTLDPLQAIRAVNTLPLLQRAVAVIEWGAPQYDPRLIDLNQKLWSGPDDLTALIHAWAVEQSISPQPSSR